MEDGTDPFGDHLHTARQNDQEHWNTDTWQAEMQAKYADGPIPRQIAFDPLD
jgi:hypothetical protein